MAISEHGAARAAGQLGITVEEYRSREAAGQRSCSNCRDWLPIMAFTADAHRPRGVKAYCLDCRNGFDRARRARRRTALKASS
jgi:hypothetical protein